MGKSGGGGGAKAAPAGAGASTSGKEPAPEPLMGWAARTLLLLLISVLAFSIRCVFLSL
jgi:hypothetical protein